MEGTVVEVILGPVCSQKVRSENVRQWLSFTTKSLESIRGNCTITVPEARFSDSFSDQTEGDLKYIRIQYVCSPLGSKMRPGSG